MIFLNFLNFFAIFFEFCTTDEIGTERNDNFYFLSFSFFSTQFWLQKKPQRYFIIFWFFFANFLEFSITLRVRRKQNDNFYFLSFSVFSCLFWLEMKPYWFFWIFWFFLLFFWNFVLRMWLERNGTRIVIFSRSWPFPPYFVFKGSHNGIF